MYTVFLPNANRVIARERERATEKSIAGKQIKNTHRIQVDRLQFGPKKEKNKKKTHKIYPNSIESDKGNEKMWSKW